MTGIVAFLVVHLVLVVLVPSTLVAMIIGRFGHGTAAARTLPADGGREAR
jgi:hypothetical protein